jgi:hypothetical protein
MVTGHKIGHITLPHTVEEAPAKQSLSEILKFHVLAGAEARSGAALASSSLLILAEYLYFSGIRLLRSLRFFRAQFHNRSASSGNLLLRTALLLNWS